MEQITGTEIYSSISQKVFEIAKNKEHELRLAEAALGELKPLTYQEEKNLIEKLNGEIQTRDEQEKVYEKKQQDLRLLQKREEYREKLKEVLRRKELVFQELSNFSPWQERLERALKAHEITPLFESIQQSRYEFKSRQVDLSNDRDRLKTQKEQLLTLMTQEEQYKKSVKQIQDNMKSLNTLFDRVIALDIELAQNNDRLQRIQRERSQREEELEQSEQALVENQGKFQEQMKAISLLEQYQSAYGADSRLSEDLYEMMAKFEAFKNEKESIESLKIKSEQLCRVRQKQQTLLDRERLCLAKLVEELQQKEQELSQQDEVLKIHLNGKLLREYETEEKALYKERELLLVIASLQSHRRALREGAPCPLCGATHHPYASENFPAPSELDQKIEALQSKIVSIRNAQETLETLRKSYTKKEKEFEEVKLQNKVHQTVLEQTLNQLKEVETAIENKGDELHETQSTLIEMIKVYEIDLAEVPSLEQALQKLKHRLDFWQQNQQQLILGRQNLQSLLIEKQRLQALMSTLQKQINTLIEQEIQQEGDYQLRQQTRKNLFQNKDPKVEREALHNKLLDCQNTLSQLREQRTSLAIENSQLEGIIQTNQQVLNEIKDQLRADEQGLTEQFQRLGFINQTDYLEALLPGQECDRLLQKRQSLEERVDDLNSQEKLLRNELSEAQKWIIEECTISEVEAKIREQRKILDELIGQISEKEFRLRENQRVKQELNDRVLNLQKLNEDCHHWGVLLSLIHI
mgnify:CR=1 FL=1